MQPGDIIIIVFVVLAAIAAGLYFLNRWAARKMTDQQSMIDKSKQTIPIFVIDKKKDYAKNVNLPKIVSDNLPKLYKFMKVHFVQAKIGPQVMTLICDKKIFKAISVKKNVTVEMAGIYIVSIKGMKSDYEKKEELKKKKEKEKELKKAQKGKK